MRFFIFFMIMFLVLSCASTKESDDICNLTNGGIEKCDGIDNNCNGLIDENPVLICSNLPNVVSAYCFNAACKIENCKAEFANIDDNWENGCEPYDCEITNNGIEICDGLDNDCNYKTDEDLISPPADKNVGVCKNSVKICDSENGWIEPDYTIIANYQESEDKCDDLDNDCDGEIDAGMGCACEENEIQNCVISETQCESTQTCLNGDWDVCINDGTKGKEDLFGCDGIDNNCDLSIDEHLKNSEDVYVNINHCGSCNTKCENNYGTTECTNIGECNPVCVNGFFNTDGSNKNGCDVGCEVNLHNESYFQEISSASNIDSEDYIYNFQTNEMVFVYTKADGTIYLKKISTNLTTEPIEIPLIETSTDGTSVKKYLNPSIIYQNFQYYLAYTEEIYCETCEPQYTNNLMINIYNNDFVLTNPAFLITQNTVTNEVNIVKNNVSNNIYIYYEDNGSIFIKLMINNDLHDYLILNKIDVNFLTNKFSVLNETLTATVCESNSNTNTSSLILYVFNDTINPFFTEIQQFTTIDCSTDNGIQQNYSLNIKNDRNNILVSYLKPNSDLYIKVYSPLSDFFVEKIDKFIQAYVFIADFDVSNEKMSVLYAFNNTTEGEVDFVSAINYKIFNIPVEILDDTSVNLIGDSVNIYKRRNITIDLAPADKIFNYFTDDMRLIGGFKLKTRGYSSLNTFKTNACIF